MSLVLQITQAPSQVTVLFFPAPSFLQYTWVNSSCLLEPFVLLRSLLWWKLWLVVALNCTRSWRNVSAIKSACCSCKRPAFPSPIWMFTTTCQSSSRGSYAIFWHQRAPGTHVVRTHKYRQNIQMHKIKIFFKYYTPNWERVFQTIFFIVLLPVVVIATFL